MNRLPLEDITILDLTWVIAGPHATRLFGDLGARIIKVESKRSLDVLRTGIQRKGNKDFRKEGGWAYNDLNHGKMDIAINLKSVKGREAFEDLVRISDIVVANYGTGAFHKLRLTFDDLVKIKSDIIVLNASGLGDWGPYCKFVSFAPVVQAMTGIASSVGYEDSDVPFDKYPPMADYEGSLSICNHLMAALEYRRKTGKGQFIDLSQVESAASYMGTAILNWQVNGEVKGLFGNHHYADFAAPHNVYPCKGDEDQWCAIAVSSEEEWQRFRKAVDPEGAWTLDPRFETLKDRIANQGELDARVSGWTRRHTPEEVGNILQSAGVSGVPVQSAQDMLYRDEHLKARKYFMEMNFEPSDQYPPKFIITGPLMRFPERTYPHTVSPAPSVGQDTHFVLTQILGKSEEWIESAREEEAFE
jgi:crotonobetainyl-CoA:carnitine CoA-transferase CaiB-like acyl-CoA transferase